MSEFKQERDSQDRSSMRRFSLSLLTIACAFTFLSGELPASPPNVIVILADDQGYADLSCQGVASDVRTPQIDSLAANGIRMTAGYVTAPQCSPSRAALITGRYQQRFGVDEIANCPLPLEEITIAERLQTVGYRTGMVGKWHLSPNPVSVRWAKANLPNIHESTNGRVNIPLKKVTEFHPHTQGFDEYFVGEIQQYFANYDFSGTEAQQTGKWRRERGYRIDLQTQASVSFIERNHDQPFFLYLCYFGPHVPLQATPKYLDRFSDPMKERRRYGLAMLAAIDDGVGKILAKLREHGLEENTLIVYSSDNGAPLKLKKPDDPIGQGGPVWDGSLNDPWIGEKGMLSEGGIRVPFIVQWKDRLPQGIVFDEPVSTLDIAATTIAAAGIDAEPVMDGVNLIPFLMGENQESPHESLFWRFWNQSAIRVGKWKYLRVGQDREYLFDLSLDAHEETNLLAQNPGIVTELSSKLEIWAKEMLPPGAPTKGSDHEEQVWYRHYFPVSPQ